MHPILGQTYFRFGSIILSSLLRVTSQGSRVRISPFDEQTAGLGQRLLGNRRKCLLLGLTCQARVAEIRGARGNHSPALFSIDLILNANWYRKPLKPFLCPTFKDRWAWSGVMPNPCSSTERPVGLPFCLHRYRLSCDKLFIESSKKDTAS